MLFQQKNLVLIQVNTSLETVIFLPPTRPPMVPPNQSPRSKLLERVRRNKKKNRSRSHWDFDLFGEKNRHTLDKPLNVGMLLQCNLEKPLHVGTLLQWLASHADSYRL
eukprot:6418450-Amphidinium_carterae.1